MPASDEVAYSASAFAAAAARVAATAPATEPTDPALLNAFLEQFAADAFLGEFEEIPIEDAAALALDLWRFGATSPSEGRSIRLREAIGVNGRLLAFDVAEIFGPDMAFLVDSAIGVCQEARVEVRAVLHPLVQRPSGLFSFIQVHLPRLSAADRSSLEQKFRATYVDVERVNADFGPMRQRMIDISRQLANVPAAASAMEEFSESRAFLEWLANDQYTFLGVRDYHFPTTADGEPTTGEPIVDAATGLGILRDPTQRVLSRTAEPTLLTPSIRAFLDEPTPVMVAKASFVSRVHRRVHADYVGVKRYDAGGRVVGETRFVGLFTSDAYTQAADIVPLIRAKIARVKQTFATQSRFSAKQLDGVLKNLPRDELFQASVDDLVRIARGALHLMVRPRTRLLIRRDRFDRYVSALLYVPRDSFNSELRARAHKLIADAYAGRTSAFYPSFNDGPLARVHLIIGLDRGHPEPDAAALEAEVAKLFQSWDEALAAAAGAGTVPVAVAGARFNAAYREAFAPEEGLKDLETVSAIAEQHMLRVRVRHVHEDAAAHQIKIYHRGSALELADVVPVIERMGLRVRYETAYPVRLPGLGAGPDAAIWIHAIVLSRGPQEAGLDARFERAFEAVWNRETENDTYNSLVTALGVDWRAAAILRTLGRWRSQSGLDPTEIVQVKALHDYPEIAKELLELFAIRFDPDRAGDLDVRRRESEPVVARIRERLQGVTSLDADRVLRRLLSLVLGIQRTNFYLHGPDGAPDRHITVKIASREVEALPEPRPFREIFVCSPEVEGVHLRFGPVARGGLRWSDRRDDFRTEVLALVKAQQVKNAVIVPVGAKGGFFPKALPVGGPREALQAAGVAAYKTFVGALLQITDNLSGDAILRDHRLVAWDGDDPYLVVAADKGTATFSDTANGIAGEYGFWLGDAFASGGSAGYDHKGMGITARGAWEAVKRHFREMGRETQSQPFTVIGVGDMSGDVFGNGMLLSRHIKLIAAFDHRHIFLDPEPADLAVSFDERQRLFNLPRSSWADYDPTRISAGGGVFDRSLKAIELSPEIRTLTGLAGPTATPAELMHALLKAPTDLLWFGGIGGFIKASNQSHADVGDKANDAVRVNASEVRALVIGEGANLGVTQAGRVEFARRGGRINTDAIDNSAGVATSDREVNIKILLTDAIARGDLAAAERNNLLQVMTDDVARLVLRDNYDQTGALSMLQSTAAADLDAHALFIEQMEAAGKLDRAVEGLPGRDEIAVRRNAGEGLTRPELAVLLAYAKLDLFAGLVASAAPDDPAFAPMLVDYFPDALHRFEVARGRHRLRREIIATTLCNRIVNRAGPTFAANQIANGMPLIRVAQGFHAAWTVFGFADLFRRIEEQDGRLPAETQIRLQAEASNNLRMLTMSFAADPALAHGATAAALADRYAAAIPEIRLLLPAVLAPLVSARVDARAEAYRRGGAPADLAHDIAVIRALASGRETVDIAARTGWPLRAVALVQHEAGRWLGVDRMRAAAADLNPSDGWERQALLRVADDLPRQQSEMAYAVIEAAKRDRISADQLDAAQASRLVDEWMTFRRDLADRVAGPASRFDAEGAWSLAKLVLAGDALRDFVYAIRMETGEWDAPPKDT